MQACKMQNNRGVSRVRKELEYSINLLLRSPSMHLHLQVRYLTLNEWAIQAIS